MHTFNTYLLSQDKSRVTVSMIEKTVYDFCNWCEDESTEAQQANYNDVLAYIKHLQKRGFKQRTIQMYISYLNHYFNWVIACEVRTHHPTKDIKIKNVQRKFLYQVVSLPDLEKIYEQLTGNEKYLSGTYRVWDKHSHFSIRYHKAMFGLVIWQGLGLGEINRLTIEDVKLREGKIYIAGDRRSNERTLKLEAVQIMDLMEYLQEVRVEYLRTNPTAGNLFFISYFPGATPDNRMHGLIQRIKTLDTRITGHRQLRASVIVHWLKNYNLRQVQYMAGHRYVSSTESYLVNDMEYLQEDITKFHPLG